MVGRLRFKESGSLLIKEIRFEEKNGYVVDSKNTTLEMCVCQALSQSQALLKVYMNKNSIKNRINPNILLHVFLSQNVQIYDVSI